MSGSKIKILCDHPACRCLLAVVRMDGGSLALDPKCTYTYVTPPDAPEPLYQFCCPRRHPYTCGRTKPLKEARIVATLEKAITSGMSADI